MKTIKKIFIVSFLILVLIYVTNITSIPSNIILFQGETLSVSTILGVSLNKDKEDIAIQASSNLENENKVEKISYKLNLFGGIPLKDIDVNIIPRTKVIPLGNTVGLKLYTSGVLVVGKSEIEGIDNKKYKPYENSGIEEGDMIIKINNNTVTCTADLLENVNSSNRKKCKCSIC